MTTSDTNFYFLNENLLSVNYLEDIFSENVDEPNSKFEQAVIKMFKIQ